ncbi:hypothetical protein ACHAWF_000375, partial [Thalassiosira exigua]
MGHLGFKSKGGDPDVWMRPITRADGNKVYEYVLLYTDDCLVVSDNAEEILKKEIGGYFELKEAYIGPPKLYLGGHLRQVQINDGTQTWAFSFEDYLSKQGKSLKAKASNVLPKDYRPEIDVTTELEAEEASYYQSLIGVLRWMVELGRVGICTERPFEEFGPGDMPEPRGEGFRIVTCVDCDLGGDCATRRSRTGFAVFLNGAPLYWMSEKQSSC